MNQIQNNAEQNNSALQQKRNAAIIGTATAGLGFLAARHIIKGQAAKKAAEEAAKKAKPFYSNIMGGVKNIASGKSGAGAIALVSAAAAGIFYRHKLGGALSKAMGGLKDLPEKLSSTIKKILPSRLKKIPTPVDGFVKEGKRSLEVGRESVFSLLELGKKGLSTASDIADKLNPIKGFFE